MKKVLSLPIFIAIVAVLNAFASKRESLSGYKKYVGIFFENAKYYIVHDPSNWGTPFQIPTNWQEGVDYVCLSCSYNDLCTVTTLYYNYPTFEPETGLYYLDSEDVINSEGGMFFSL